MKQQSVLYTLLIGLLVLSGLVTGQPSWLRAEEQPVAIKINVQESIGSDWLTECIDCPKRFNQMTEHNLQLDSSGHPHIAYGGDHLYYSWYTGEIWNHVTVDSSPNDNYLMYAVNQDGMWHLQRVVFGGAVGSLAVDRAGNPSISYFDRLNLDLRYARLLNPLQLQKEAQPREGLLSGGTITYTLTLSGPGGAAHLRDPLPTAVRYRADSLTGDLTPPASYDPAQHAIVWAGSLVTDTVQTIRFQVEPITPPITGTVVYSLTPPILITHTTHSKPGHPHRAGTWSHRLRRGHRQRSSPPSAPDHARQTVIRPGSVVLSCLCQTTLVTLSPAHPVTPHPPGTRLATSISQRTVCGKSITRKRTAT
jgi:hypothetical protein